jgi:exosortase/archaeosortase family protein
VVEIDGRRLLVADACSGVSSLFSVLACTLFLVLLRGRPPVRSMLLLAAAAFWVLAANVARVVLIAWLLARHSIDLSEGWRHEALGLALFAVAVGLTASTDQLLSFLFAPAEPAPESPPAPQPPPAAGSGFAWSAVVAAPAFLLLLGVQLAGQARAGAADERPVPQERLASLDENALPEKIGPWQGRAFHAESRGAGNYFGEHSLAWAYRQGQQTATFSLDYPFPAWHDLTRCYTGQGWRMEEQAVRQRPDVPGGLVVVRLSKPGRRSGYLLFCQFNGRGEPLPARRGAAYLSLFRHRAALGAAEQDGPADDPAGPVYQWQLMVEGHAPLSAEEEAALEEEFARTYAGLLGRLKE